MFIHTFLVRIVNFSIESLYIKLNINKYHNSPNIKIFRSLTVMYIKFLCLHVYRRTKTYTSDYRFIC